MPDAGRGRSGRSFGNLARRAGRLVRRDAKLLSIIALFIVVISFVVFYNVRATDQQRGTTVFVNATARQRPLVQRYMKDVLLGLDGHAADPETTAANLRSTNHALLYGGMVLSPRAQDVFVHIDGATDREVRRKLLHEKGLIDAFTQQGRQLLVEGRQARFFAADLDRLLLDGAELSAVTNDVVGQITHDTESSLANLVRVEVLLGSMGAIAAVLMGMALHRDGMRQSARFRSLVHNSTDLITVVDKDNLITYQSPSSERLLGYPPRDVLGRPVLDFVHPNDQVELLEQLLTALTGSGTTTADFETRLRSRGGAWLIFQGTATNLLRDKTVRGVVLNARDVTDRKRAAAELAEARDLALDASLMKGQFLATMSHEIRTPMNAVIGLTELLLGTELDGEQREYATGVHEAGEGLLGLINDILDFSKIEAGKIELEDADLDLRAVAEGAVSLLGDTAGAKGVELLAHCYPDVPEQLRGDPTRLRQVLVNLVSNAVKFTANGEIILRAERVEDTPTTCVVRFDVTDSGIGIAAEDQARLFEPFSQADASTTRKYGGTGLGLAITKELIELMGGELTVTSEPNVGSTFTFAIPFTKATDRSSPRPVMTDSMANLHALIVDDNATNRLILTQQLRSWGVTTVEAIDGPAALERLREGVAEARPFDVAILDFNMPGMDGLQLARAVKADPDIAHAHLFLLSSSGQRLNRDAARRAGLDGSMTKPVRQSELYDCLRDGLGVAASAEPVDVPAASATGSGYVLLVEDNKMNQLVASRILAKLGYSVEIADNGQIAVDLVTSKRFDAVLMDCQMPVMDGYQATAEIRRLEGGDRHTPIIAMTAAAMEGDREVCIAAGMDDYLTKPIHVDILATTLAPWISPIADEPSSSSDSEGATVTEAAQNTDPVDPDRLDMLRELDDGDGMLLGTILDAFLADTTATAADLHDAVEPADPHRIEQCAHSIKGAAANVGADRLAEICAGIERCGKANEMRDAEALLPEFDQELDRVRNRLDHVLTGG